MKIICYQTMSTRRHNAFGAKDGPDQLLDRGGSEAKEWLSGREPHLASLQGAILLQ